MRRFVIPFLIASILIGCITPMAYGEEVKLSIEEEKYRLLKEENLRLRKEILRLRNELSENKAEKIPVLTYHHILKQEDIERYNWTNNTSVLSLEAFEKQMDYLYENGFYTASLDELQAFIDGKISLPEKTVVITFDDGYLSNALYAYPIMKKYNFRGTIFMLGYRVDDVQAPFDPSTTQSISIHEAYRYEDVFDYESHTYALHDIDENGEKLLMSSDKEVILEDLRKSKELLDAKYFAYPYGAYDENTIEYLKEAGYEMAFTIKKGYVSKDSNKYQLPRFSILPRTPFSRFKRIVNGIEYVGE
ncbi:MAG: polysaccharide deacetylase family protein [Tissierellia bacterium]|nr:polysaccharide deacetylase family protein [Tissierellia bacterium]